MHGVRGHLAGTCASLNLTHEGVPWYEEVAKFESCMYLRVKDEAVGGRPALSAALLLLQAG